ncbi:MAG: hypothetical protein R3176_07215 [Woeseiaceae bacterium]|nr:hypothetical protein [Woeseiaceae bacterium]
MITIRTLVLVGINVIVSACGGDAMSGTYADEASITQYEFHRDGRATVHVLGTTVPAEYTRDGDRVFVTSAQGTVVLRHSGDHLYGPMGLELTRRPE